MVWDPNRSWHLRDASAGAETIVGGHSMAWILKFRPPKAKAAGRGAAVANGTAALGLARPHSVTRISTASRPAVPCLATPNWPVS